MCWPYTTMGSHQGTPSISALLYQIQSFSVFNCTLFAYICQRVKYCKASPLSVEKIAGAFGYLGLGDGLVWFGFLGFFFCLTIEETRRCPVQVLVLWSHPNHTSSLGATDTLRFLRLVSLISSWCRFLTCSALSNIGCLAPITSDLSIANKQQHQGHIFWFLSDRCFPGWNKSPINMLLLIGSDSLIN